MKESGCSRSVVRRPDPLSMLRSKVMSTRGLKVLLAAVAVLCSVATVAADNDVVVREPGSQTTAGKAQEHIEEIVVQGSRLEKTPMPVRIIFDTCKAYRKGAYLYRTHRYEESFPHLLRAAKRGFKDAQLRVGYMYLTGLGEVIQDNYAAVGWIGLSARKRSVPRVQNFWRRLKAQIPESLHSEVEILVDSYDARYGSKVNRVYCDRGSWNASHIKGLICWFRDTRFWGIPQAC